jgi:hypothetical protein
MINRHILMQLLGKTPRRRPSGDAIALYHHAGLGEGYETTGNADFVTNCHALLAGDKVAVWYLSRDPEVNVSGDPCAAKGRAVHSRC